VKIKFDYPTTFPSNPKIHPFGGLTRINIERNFANGFNNISINRSEIRLGQ